MQPKNLSLSFTLMDRSILHLGMKELSLFEQQVLTYRFWENLTIEEISKLLQVSWNEIDQTIEQSFKKLRDFCLKHQEFSLHGSKWLG